MSNQLSYPQIWLRSLNTHCLRLEGIPAIRLVDKKYIIAGFKRWLDPETCAEVICARRIGRIVPCWENDPVHGKLDEVVYPIDDQTRTYQITSPCLPEPLMVSCSSINLHTILPELSQRLSEYHIMEVSI